VGALLRRLGWAPACDTEIRLNDMVADGGEESLLQLSTAELRAVEYHRAGALPAELASDARCGVVVLWTR
jgi:hypothetical protein